MLEFLKETFADPYVLIVLFTFIPFLELRFSIPYGIIKTDEPWYLVAAAAIAANILLGPIVFLMLDKLLHVALRIGFVKRFWDRVILKTQKKVHPMVEKYGILGLGLFIGVPLPGSGVYSGAFGGYILGFTKKEFYIATVVGVLIAAAAVTAISLAGNEFLQSLFLKK